MLLLVLLASLAGAPVGHSLHSVTIASLYDVDDGGGGDAAVAGPVAPSASNEELEQAIKDTYQAVREKKGPRAIAIAFLMLLIAGLRSKIVKDEEAKVKFFRTKRGAAVMGIAFGVLFGMVHALAAQAPVTLGLVGDGILNGLFAGGGVAAFMLIVAARGSSVDDDQGHVVPPDDEETKPGR